MPKHRPRHHLNMPAPVFCDGKRRYPSRQEAETVKEEQELLTHNLELRVYRCSLGCGGWHLTRAR